jgi:hypothetical protein
MHFTGITSLLRKHSTAHLSIQLIMLSLFSAYLFLFPPLIPFVVAIASGLSARQAPVTLNWLAISFREGKPKKKEHLGKFVAVELSPG